MRVATLGVLYIKANEVAAIGYDCSPGGSVMMT